MTCVVIIQCTIDEVYVVESQITNADDCSRWDFASRQAWPEGVPAGERSLWSALTEANREKALERLEALTAYEERRDLQRRLDETGLTKRGFFTLLKRWRDERSIASLLPRAAGIGRTSPADVLDEDLLDAILAEVKKDRSRAIADISVAALKVASKNQTSASDVRALDRAVRAVLLDTVVSDLLAEHPDWAKSRVVGAAMSLLREPPAASTVRRVVERLRAAPTGPLVGASAGLGARVLIASCPAMRRASRSTEHVVWAHVGLVVDVATRTVLGGSAAPQAYDAMMWAAEGAAEFCAKLVAGGSPDAVPVIEVLVPDGANPLVVMRQADAVAQVATWEQADQPTDRTTSSALIGLVGRSLGVLDLRPRGVSEGATEDPQIVGDLLARHLGKTRVGVSELPTLSVPRPAIVAALRAFAA